MLLQLKFKDVKKGEKIHQNNVKGTKAKEIEQELQLLVRTTMQNLKIRDQYINLIRSN